MHGRGDVSLHAAFTGRVRMTHDVRAPAPRSAAPAYAPPRARSPRSRAPPCPFLPMLLPAAWGGVQPGPPMRAAARADALPGGGLQIANKFSKAQNELIHERRQCEALQSDLQRIQNVCAPPCRA